MTSTFSVRLDDETDAQLAVLAERAKSRNSAIVAAVRAAYQTEIERQLAEGYAAAVAENPYYPYESKEDYEARRKRRTARVRRRGEDPER